MKNFPKFLLCLCIILLIWALWIGYSWHMIPVYTGILIIALSLVISKPIRWKKTLAGSVFLLAGLSLFLLYLFPFVEMPKPAGPYAVGVTYRKVDTDRDEVFTKEQGDKRSLYLKIWYPAKAGENVNAYMEEGEKVIGLLMEQAGVPAFPFQQLAKTKTNSYTNAPIADGSFPLLTFSHGWGSWFGQNTALMEALASKGYIVASIAHSHQTAFAAASENELVTFPRIVPPGDTTGYVAPDTARQNLVDKIIFQKSVTDRSVLENFFMDMIAGDTLANQQVVIWADDISSTIDFMLREAEATESIFHHHIQSGNIGALGMSFGGAASAEAALRDQRILAAVNLDGLQFGSWLNDTIKIPVLFLESQKSSINLSMYGPFFSRSKSDIYSLIFKKAEHFNFTDVSLFSPAFKWLGLLGEVDGEFMIDSMNSIVPDYFESVFSNRKFQVQKHIKPGAIEEAIY